MLWWLEELDSGNGAAVGAKTVNLAAMIRAGLPVPPGFVLEAPAGQAHLEAAGLLAPIAERLRALAPEDRAAVEAACSAIAGRIEAAPVPAAVAEAVLQAYAELEHRTGQRNLPVAVRCSALADESGATGACSYETVLGVRGATALLDAIRHGWAGAWAPEAVASRLRMNRGHQSAGVAVVVQAMVEADAAGEIGPPPPGLSGGYLITESARFNEAEAHCLPLSSVQLAELEALAGQVERVCGAPQRVDWALAEGQFWLLQAGPAPDVGRGDRRQCDQAERERMAARLKAQYPDPPLPFDLSFMAAMHRGAVVRELPDGSFEFLPGVVRTGLAAFWRSRVRRLLQVWKDPQQRWAALRDEVVARLDELDWPERGAAGLLEQARALVGLLGEYRQRLTDLHPAGAQAEAGPVPLPSSGARLALPDPTRQSGLALLYRLVSSLRRTMLALGAELTRRGRLARPHDVFYLRLEELDQVVEGTLVPTPIVARRRRAHARTCAAQERGLHWTAVGRL
jgi:hypothetical protein